jgi:hypothetical protein
MPDERGRFTEVDAAALLAASRELVRQAREHVAASRAARDIAQQRLDRSRNLLQAISLRQELHRRRLAGPDRFERLTDPNDRTIL